MKEGDGDAVPHSHVHTVSATRRTSTSTADVGRVLRHVTADVAADGRRVADSADVECLNVGSVDIDLPRVDIVYGGIDGSQPQTAVGHASTINGGVGGDVNNYN